MIRMLLDLSVHLCSVSFGSRRRRLVFGFRRVTIIFFFLEAAGFDELFIVRHNSRNSIPRHYQPIYGAFYVLSLQFTAEGSWFEELVHSALDVGVDQLLEECKPFHSGQVLEGF